MPWTAASNYPSNLDSLCGLRLRHKSVWTRFALPAGCQAGQPDLNPCRKDGYQTKMCITMSGRPWESEKRYQSNLKPRLYQTKLLDPRPNQPKRQYFLQAAANKFRNTPYTEVL